jgi:OmpA-OmpF porin, OOP family
MTYLRVVKGKPIQESMVAVNAAAMARDIAAQGHVAIYGVYFDTDEATLKPGSKPALDEMAKLLANEPNPKVYIVGHTDNVGTLGYNLGLSSRRAEAVTHALETTYHVAPSRLVPRGVGPLAPVASNDTEAGRAKNRRVELVKQYGGVSCASRARHTIVVARSSAA